MGSYVDVDWTVENRSQFIWHRNVQLKANEVSGLDIKPVKLNFQLQPREQGNIKATFWVPSLKNKSDLFIMFYLEDTEGIFGESLLATIKVDDGKVIKYAEPKDPNDLKQWDLPDEKLYSMASMLVDEGYADFERCFNILKAVNGDIDSARGKLTQIIFSEAQKNQWFD